MPTSHILPTGLGYHCSDCMLVVPSDAPRPTPDAPQCDWVRLHKLSWFNPKETLAGQHVMAVATHSLIYSPAIKSATPDVATRAYHLAHRKSRKAHFTESATFKALTPEQIAAESVHKRDGWLYR